MTEPILEQVTRKMTEAAQLYHRLVLVVAPAGQGKTKALLDLQERTGVPYVNVNLELSRKMLGLTQRQRMLRLPGLLHALVDRSTGDAVALDNVEILFDVALAQDPLRLLERLSRNCTVVAAWNGSVEDGSLTYAKPGHPEYRRYPARGLLVAAPGQTA